FDGLYPSLSYCALSYVSMGITHRYHISPFQGFKTTIYVSMGYAHRLYIAPLRGYIAIFSKP
ncbi:MAG: hypothetical protein ACHQIM_09385, partial [Sphingobacteriales bacterium]